MILNLKDLTPQEAQNFLQHSIAPRPICFASTVDAEGNVNLSPFSFFNLFSSNPPIVIFSPARRVRNNTTKHTLNNLFEVPEVAINMVDYRMVHQMSLASCEYEKGVNEFIKAGFTEEKSSIIRPPLVKESKIKMECKVLEIKALGDGGGAGNLVICEVMVMHIDESILDSNGKIDQTKVNLVARLGGDWYSKTDINSLFKVAKPNVNLGVGVDQLPSSIRNSKVLTGNDLGKLANVTSIPDPDPSFDDENVKTINQYFSLQPDECEMELHKYAATLLGEDKVQEAWQVLLYQN